MLQSAEYLAWKQPTVGKTSAECRPHLILVSSASKEAIPAINDLKSLLEQVSLRFAKLVSALPSLRLVLASLYGAVLLSEDTGEVCRREDLVQRFPADAFALIRIAAANLPLQQPPAISRRLLRGGGGRHSGLGQEGGQKEAHGNEDWRRLQDTGHQ